MAPVDRVLQRFLREIGLTNHDALTEHNLAPLVVRRQISALGVIHRRVLGISPKSITELLPMAEQNRPAYNTRLARHLHDKQLVDHATGRTTEMFRRSVFGYVGVYNRLPQAIVGKKTVKEFQRQIQSTIVGLAKCGCDDLHDFLSVRQKTSDIDVFQRRFQL